MKRAFNTLTNAVNVATSDAHASVNADPKIDMDPHSCAMLESVNVLLERFSGHSLGLLATGVLQMANGIGEEGNASETGPSTWLNAKSE